MRKLLDKTTQRRLAILEDLNDRTVWVSSKELAKLKNVTLRTIASDINYLKEKGESFFELETSTKNGVKLNINPNIRLADGYSVILQKSECFQFIEHLFFEPHFSVDNWSEKLFISESTLYRITHQVKQVLAKNDITLNLRPCYLHAKSEEHVRQFYAHYFSEAYTFHEWPYPLDKKLIYQLATEIYHLSGLYSDEYILSRCAHLLAVSLLRYQQGFYITDTITDKITEEVYEKLDKHPLFYSLLEQLGFTVSKHFLLDFIHSIYFLKSIWFEKHLHLDLEKQLNEFINILTYRLGVSITEESRTRTISCLANLHFKFKQYPNNEYIIFDLYKHSRKGLVTTYQPYVSIVETALKSLEESSQIPWYSEYADKVLYWLMIIWQSLPTALGEQQPVIKLLLFNHSGQAHAELLQEMIQSTFPKRTDITIFTGSTLFMEDADLSSIKNHDLVISTFSSSLFPREKTLVIEPVLTDLNFEVLYQKIKHFIKMSQLPIKQSA